jgi:hypothetical protein
VAQLIWLLVEGLQVVEVLLRLRRVMRRRTLTLAVMFWLRPGLVLALVLKEQMAEEVVALNLVVVLVLERRVAGSVFLAELGVNLRAATW